MARRHATKVSVEPPPPRKPRPLREEGDTDAHEFIRSVNDLRHSVEDLTEEIRKLRVSTDILDSHNGVLCASIDTLASRLDVISGVGSIVKSLLPRSRR